jgi:hypothetical protein
MSDHELAARYFEAQVAEAPKRVAAYREALGPEARAELEAIHGAPDLHAKPVDAELAARLGKALDMPVAQSETVGAGGVRVSADGKTLLVGPGATVGDVLGHIGTVGALKRYQGAIGLVRRVADAVGRVFGRGGPPFGTIAHEAWHEIQKLPGLMEATRAQLLDPELDPLTRAHLVEKLARIEEQIARHVSELGDLSPGRGYVEMAGRRSKTKPIGERATLGGDKSGPEPGAAAESTEAETPAQKAAKQKAGELRQEKALKEAELERLLRQRSELEREKAQAENAKNGALDDWRRAAGSKEEVDAARARARDANKRVEALREALDELDDGAGLWEAVKELDAAIAIERVKADPRGRGALPCFAAETLVSTPRGPRPISELCPGDEVWTYDLSTDTCHVRPVLQCHRGLTKAFHRVHTADGVVRATSQHRFWVDNDAAWRKAESLEAGMRLRRLGGGQMVITGVDRESDTEAPTFNLSVDEFPTYFVGPGVLVHNAAVDMGLGDEFLIYRATNPDPKYANKVYVGQTTVLDKEGKPRGREAREDEHRKLARKRLKEHADGKRKLSDSDKEFYEFMKNANLETVVKGIATQAQADFLEQHNIDFESGKPGGEKDVINRRNEITRESHLQDVLKGILEDPAVKAKGYCP